MTVSQLKANCTVTPNGCWLWKGAINSDGYAFKRFKGKVKAVHRLAYELHTAQELPSTVVLRHSCGNRNCINPDHLSVGTKGDNNRDMVRDGTHRCKPKQIQIGEKKYPSIKAASADTGLSRKVFYKYVDGDGVFDVASYRASCKRYGKKCKV